MNGMTIKKIILCSFLVMSNVIVMADCLPDDCNSCTREYVCGCNPLYCGTFSLQVHGGIAPILWRNRGEVDLVSGISGSGFPFVQLSDSFPKFSTLYKLPWTVGGIFGYAWSDNAELYLEFNYLQASSKNNAVDFVIPNIIPVQTLSIGLSKYQLFDAYIGARYYFDRWCDQTSFFIGGKLGLTHHRKARGSLALAGFDVACASDVIAPCNTPTCQACPSISSSSGCLVGCNSSFFSSNTVVSGGINAGLDFCICGGWSVTVTAELVASCGPHITAGAFAVPLLPPTLATQLIVGCIQTELRFPITAGVKYIF